jgi:hypothetical protein
MEKIDQYTPIVTIMELPEFDDYLNTRKRVELKKAHVTYRALQSVCKYPNEELKGLFWEVFSKTCKLTANERWWIDTLIHYTCKDIIYKYLKEQEYADRNATTKSEERH